MVASMATSLITSPSKSVSFQVGGKVKEQHQTQQCPRPAWGSQRVSSSMRRSDSPAEQWTAAAHSHPATLEAAGAAQLVAECRCMLRQTDWPGPLVGTVPSAQLAGTRATPAKGAWARAGAVWAHSEF